MTAFAKKASVDPGPSSSGGRPRDLRDFLLDRIAEVGVTGLTPAELSADKWGLADMCSDFEHAPEELRNEYISMLRT